jgi:hypothetical protein
MDRAWTTEGLDEAGNFRLQGPLQQVPPDKLNSASFVALLANGHPIRIEIPGHVIAIVGYDAAAQTFTFVDTLGDRGHVDGFGTYPFASIDAGSPDPPRVPWAATSPRPRRGRPAVSLGPLGRLAAGEAGPSFTTSSETAR